MKARKEESMHMYMVGEEYGEDYNWNISRLRAGEWRRKTNNNFLDNITNK